MNPIRLQVYLAHCGAASRRAAETLITEGRVSVNNEIITYLGAKVSETDTVCLDGKPLSLEKTLHYLALNKPSDYICASHDPQKRALAISLLPDSIKERLYNVGRLDFRSCGLLLFTNDGGFAAKVSHPSANIEKEYLVQASSFIPHPVIDSFLRGVPLEDELFQAKKIEKINRTTIKVVLIEGKNREIRRVFSHFHLHPVLLQRIRIGPILLGDLPEGKSRPLSETERRAILSPQ